MRQFLAILLTFELLLHFHQLFYSNLKSGDTLCTNHKVNYLAENLLSSKNNKMVLEMYLKSLIAKKKIKRVTLVIYWER